MPVPMIIGRVKILIFLDLSKNSSFLDRHYLAELPQFQEKYR
jgi:hypothetical protein